MNKNKMSFKELMFTPFRYIAGVNSFLAGIAFMLLLSVLGFVTVTNFDGALDVHYGCIENNKPYLVHLWYQFSAWFSLTCVLYIVARIASRSHVRFVDMAGTIALARIPLIFAALIGLAPQIHFCFGEQDLSTLISTLQENMSWMLLMLPLIFFIIWMVALMYNAFSVSGNLKGVKGALLFAVGLVLSEILALALNYFIIPLIS